ncbi:hypothetical protein Q3G72_027648 [Acer saccharum]|nr:hypothetical protein Q3G72_027648 [Acer saccharum]
MPEKCSDERWKWFKELGHVRIRQHVNPLTSSNIVPVQVPDWNEVYKNPTLPLMVDIGCGSWESEKVELALVLGFSSLWIMQVFDENLNVNDFRATGKTTYTLENLTENVEEDNNFDNEFEIPGNFSPMSVNQIDYNQPMYPTSSQPLSKKMSRSRDPIVHSMDRFANVMNDAIEK